MEQNEIERFRTSDEKENIIALNYNKNGRKFVITIEKKIFEEIDGQYIECLSPDEDNQILFECIKPPKTDAREIELE